MTSGDTAIEAKDGKLTLKQTPIKWYDLSSTLEALIEFTKFLQLPSTSTPLTEFPTQHLPLIARLVVESDKTSILLTKHVKKSIIRRCGVQDDKEAVEDPRLPNAVLSTAIAEVSTRVNYGVQDTPAALAVFRWELKNADSMLPIPTTDPACNASVAKERRREREEARDAFKAIYAALNEDQKKAILEKQKKKDKNMSQDSVQLAIGNSKPKPEKAGESSKPPSAGSSSETPKKEPVTRPTKPELSKTKTKQVQMMSAFFKPSKKTKPATPVKNESCKKTLYFVPLLHLPDMTYPSSETDFQRAFKPFLIRKDITLAPQNLFIARSFHTGKGKEKAEVIVLDDDGDVQMTTFKTPMSSPSKPATVEQSDTAWAGEPSSASAKELLDQFLSSIPVCRRIRSCQPRSKNEVLRRSKGIPSVRAIITKLGEAEIVGDAKAVGDLQRLLKNRKKIGLRLFQFCDNIRPPYYGTWTKTSQFVRPRVPFNKDHIAFDYSYDSGEEWEDEPEDAEEVVSSDEEDESVVADEEDEFDDWLVGDDDVQFEDGASRTGANGRSVSPSSASAGANAKRKLELEKDKDQETKKRRVVAPLVPYCAGPFWEDRIGECSVDHFKAFRIQLINDTPYPIDPFTFISEPLPDLTAQPLVHPHGVPKATIPTTAIPPLPVAIGFAIPALPVHLHPSSQVNLPAPPIPAAPTKSSASAKPKQSNRKPFPQEHLPRLLQEVEGSTLTKLHLTEQLGQIFKENKEVKKYAIEKVLGEVASKVGGKWKVHEDLMVSIFH
ncbi:hypothetical protein FRB97_004247 [Tulasnella sp. 331]|nr:hypothetical protein FRB97_004247 [Tulasnella sp. 331]